MSEKPPGSSQQPPEPSPERKPISYEQALEAAKTLRAAGEKRPLSGEYENPRIQAAWDTVDQWEAENGLRERGVGTVERAENIVRAAMMWVDAGYAELDILSNALERLNDEHADALREGNEEVIKILRDAIDGIEHKLAASNPKEKTSIKIEAKYDEAKELIAQGKLLSAIGTLHGALIDPRFKGRINDEQRDRFTRLRDETRAREQEPKNKELADFYQLIMTNFLESRTNKGYLVSLKPYPIKIRALDLSAVVLGFFPDGKVRIAIVIPGEKDSVRKVIEINARGEVTEDAGATLDHAESEPDLKDIPDEELAVEAVRQIRNFKDPDAN